MSGLLIFVVNLDAQSWRNIWNVADFNWTQKHGKNYFNFANVAYFSVFILYLQCTDYALSFYMLLAMF